VGHEEAEQGERVMEQHFCPSCGGEDLRLVASADGTFEKTAFSCQECGWAGLGSQLLISQDPAGDVDAP
jgi:predicted RNA-binding Zn-ribbon protein involved in translation (DUF1610 family)